MEPATGPWFWLPQRRVLVVGLQDSGGAAPGTDVNAPDSDGKTPLYRAACLDDEQFVKALLERGASVDALLAPGLFSSLESERLSERIRALLRKHEQAVETDVRDQSTRERVRTR